MNHTEWHVKCRIQLNKALFFVKTEKKERLSTFSQGANTTLSPKKEREFHAAKKILKKSKKSPLDPLKFLIVGGMIRSAKTCFWSPILCIGWG